MIPAGTLSLGHDDEPVCREILVMPGEELANLVDEGAILIHWVAPAADWLEEVTTKIKTNYISSNYNSNRLFQ